MSWEQGSAESLPDMPNSCRCCAQARKMLLPGLAIIIMSVKLLVTVAVVGWVALGQQIVDYSHSDYLERRQAQPHHNYHIDIQPSKDKRSYLQLPQSCALQSALADSALAEPKRVLDSEERQIERLKANMTRLLTLAESIKRAKSFLKEHSFSPFQQDHPHEDLSPAAFEAIASAEASLQQKRQQIDSRVQHLAEFIHKEFNSTKRNGFAEMQLQFESSIYRTRLAYLLELERSLRERRPTPASNFDLFFEEVEQGVSREQHELTAVGQFLSKYSLSNELKLKISNFENQLQAVSLMIKEKEACFDKNSQYLHNETRRQFERSYNELKDLKRSQTLNSEFCQGVTASLLRQLKKVLKVYNYSFACAEGLPALQNSRYILTLELQRLNATYQEIDYDNKVDAIRRFLTAQDQIRAEFIKQIQQFRLNQYSLDSTTVAGEIDLARTRLQQIERQMASPSGGKEEIDYAQIKDIISKIEQEQHAYCQLKEEYQQQYRRTDVTLRVAEHLSALKTAQYSSYVAKYNELRELESQFLNLRSSIVEQLQ